MNIWTIGLIGSVSLLFAATSRAAEENPGPASLDAVGPTLSNPAPQDVQARANSSPRDYWDNSIPQESTGSNEVPIGQESPNSGDEQPRKRFTDLPMLFELRTGFGTSVGEIGLVGEYNVLDRLALGAGIGLNIWGPIWGIHVRGRPIIGATQSGRLHAMTFETSFSQGMYAGIPAFPNDGSNCTSGNDPGCSGYPVPKFNFVDSVRTRLGNASARRVHATNQSRFCNNAQPSDATLHGHGIQLKVHLTQRRFNYSRIFLEPGTRFLKSPLVSARPGAKGYSSPTAG